MQYEPLLCGVIIMRNILDDKPINYTTCFIEYSNGYGFGFYESNNGGFRMDNKIIPESEITGWLPVDKFNELMRAVKVVQSYAA